MIECSSVEARRLILHRIFAWIAFNFDLKTLIILFQNCINLSHSQFGGNITWGGFYSCVKHLVEWNLLKMGKLSSQFRSKCTSLIKKSSTRVAGSKMCNINKDGIWCSQAHWMPYNIRWNENGREEKRAGASFRVALIYGGMGRNKRISVKKQKNNRNHSL